MIARRVFYSSRPVASSAPGLFDGRYLYAMFRGRLGVRGARREWRRLRQHQRSLMTEAEYERRLSDAQHAMAGK